MTANILIVDDDPRMCESLSLLFQRNSYAVKTANCGKDALSLLIEDNFDLAVVDIHLPDTLGTDIMADAKSISPDTAIIIITGEANLDSALIALKLGAYDYLRKPFEFEELLKTVENATTQKALLKEKEEINQQLYQSERKYRYLIQNSPDIIYTLDGQGNFTFISEAVEHLLGFTPGSLIGKHYTSIVYGSDRDLAKWFFDERRSRKRANSGIELRLARKVDDDQCGDSQPFLTVELKSMGIYENLAGGARRQHVGTHGVIRDISERKRLQAQLQNAERMEALGTLAGGIAHNFNNLLMGIQGRATLISMDLESSHPGSEHLDAINEYIQSASDLTKQLLGLARGGKYEVKPTSINDLIDRNAFLFGRTNKDITIQKRFDQGNPVVEVDRGQFEQVLLNLFVNAAQAMAEGGTLALETQVVKPGHETRLLNTSKPEYYVRIAVSDTGVGMDQKTLSRIFDPFFTTKKSKGTGMGLASAYGIIKNHNGYIVPHSEPGKGSTFNIYLPLADSAVKKEPQVSKRVSGGSEKLLLVDDEELFLYVGKSLLEKLGYAVTAVGSGEEALNVLRQKEVAIDLVILDMVMPGMNGAKVFDNIQAMRPELPIMLCSGYSVNGKVQKIIQRGCCGFIQKPFTVSELSQKVRRILNEAKQRVPLPT